MWSLFNSFELGICVFIAGDSSGTGKYNKQTTCCQIDGGRSCVGTCQSNFVVTVALFRPSISR